VNDTTGTPANPDNLPDLMSVGAGLSLLEAAEVQDDVLIVVNDLDRLNRLLNSTCDSLLVHFMKCNEALESAANRSQDPATLQAVGVALQEIAGAITGLQFQDMANQLIGHTQRRLRSCADRLVKEVMGDDEDGITLVESAPNRPNPVTQDEMDAGSIELF
jgi:hypothetical protein